MAEPRHFVVAEYLVDESNSCFRIELGANHVCPKSTGEISCALRFKYRRKRKTGPEHDLAVVGCQVHHITFTLYPLGFAPYGRKIIDCSGDLSQSVFAAAGDAAEDKLWPESSAKEEGGVRTTQSRHISITAQLFGFDLALDGKIRIASLLGLEPRVMLDTYDRVRDGPRLREAWGKAILEVLEKIRSPCPIQKLLECGVIAGLWAGFLIWPKPFNSVLA